MHPGGTMATINEQPHYYWAIPIILFIIGQTSVAIWWASELNTTVENVQIKVETLIKDNDNENLRQWARINENEDNLGKIERELAINNSQLQSLNDNLNRVETTLSENNRLIRQLIQQQATAPISFPAGP